MVLIAYGTSSIGDFSSSSKKAVDDLIIAVVLPLTGAKSKFGNDLLQGIILGLTDLKTPAEFYYFSSSKLVNNKTTIEFLLNHLPPSNPISSRKNQQSSSNKIILQITDNQGSTQLGADLASDLLSSRASILIGGLSSDESTIYSQIADKFNKMFISLIPKTIDNLENHSTTVSFALTHDFQAYILGRYLNNTFNIQTNDIAVVLDNYRKHLNHSIVDNFLTGIYNDRYHPKQSENLSFVQEKSDNNSSLSSFNSNNSNKPYLDISSVFDLGKVMDKIKIFNQSGSDKIIKDFCQKIINNSSKIVFISENRSSSKAVISGLNHLGFNGLIVGLDYWDHPDISKDQAFKNIIFASQYNQNIFGQDFLNNHRLYKSANPFEYTHPSVLLALGYDLINWIKQLYISTQTIRLDPWFRFIYSNHIQARSSFSTHSDDQTTYRLGVDRFIQKPLIINRIITVNNLFFANNNAISDQLIFTPKLDL